MLNDLYVTKPPGMDNQSNRRRMQKRRVHRGHAVFSKLPRCGFLFPLSALQCTPAEALSCSCPNGWSCRRCSDSSTFHEGESYCSFGLCSQGRRLASCFHTPFDGDVLLFKKCSKGGYFCMELCKIIRGPFDEFSKPYRIKVVGINVANNVAEPAQVIQDLSHFD